MSANGKLCLDILRESWHPSLTVAKCLEKIREMVAQPNTDDALRRCWEMVGEPAFSRLDLKNECILVTYVE